ncbi:hypothetical protein B0H14DRAFT_2581543 [Mycena olivaceomarginata]|nr:hypothetical protein B0H14DRAFT_2581543 [Mycena olivaceomarginata]
MGWNLNSQKQPFKSYKRLLQQHSPPHVMILAMEGARKRSNGVHGDGAFKRQRSNRGDMISLVIITSFGLEWRNGGIEEDAHPLRFVPDLCEIKGKWILEWGLEYAVHIAAKHFADTVALTFNGEFNNEDVAQALASLGAGEDEPKGKGGDGYLHVAPVAHIFKECCVQAEVPVLVLLLWVRTRWASLYKCLDCCLILRKLADGSDEVPDLHHEQYHDCTPTKPEWEKIQIIYEALRGQYFAMSSETMVTQSEFAEIDVALLEAGKTIQRMLRSNRVRTPNRTP